MNIRYINILKILAAQLLCVIVGSCSQDEIDGDHGETLPPGKYPLMFTASIDGMVSRADGESWVEDDEIAVQIDDYPVIGHYKLNADGSLKESDDPLSWPYEKGCVKAWYPSGDFSKQIDIDDSKQIDIHDQSNGYHAIDFLYAKSVEKRYNQTVDIVFKHQMAKVRCILIKGDGVTEEDLNTAKVFYNGFPKAIFSEDGVSGVGVNTWIASTSDHSALLVPQDMSGEELIKLELTVTVNGVGIKKEMTYTPSEAELEAGKAYTYKIKVQKDRLEVESISGAWTESLENTVPTSDKYQIYLPEDTGELGELEFSPNVTEKSADTRAGSVRCLEVLGNEFTISYKVTLDNCHLGPVFVDKNTKNQVSRTYFEIPNASSFDAYYEFSYKLASPISEKVYLVIGEHVEVGDYLFNDGKWGGIPKKIYESEDLPNEDKKTPVGIVFKVGAGGDSQHKTLDVPANYGWDETELEIRGYAVALNDASGSGLITWGPGTKLDTIVEFKANDIPGCIAKMKYSGFIATNIVKTKKNIDNYPAFKAATAFKAAGESPTDTIAGSSGWYLPSYPQLTDVRDFFKHPQRRELITAAGGGTFNVHKTRVYCTTTERYATMIWIQSFSYSSSSEPNNDSDITKTKTTKFFVRSVLTLSKSAE